jgi:hypothetical protein
LPWSLITVWYFYKQRTFFDQSKDVGISFGL